MSAHELYEWLTEAFRQGPGHAAAFVLGATALCVIFFVNWLGRRPLRKRLENVELQREQLLEAKAGLEVQAASERLENQQLLAKNQEMTVRIDELSRANASFETGLGHVTAEKQKCECEWKASAQELLELRANHVRLETTADLWRVEIDRLSGELGPLRQGVSELQQENASLRATLSSLEGEVQRAQADRTELAHKVAEYESAELDLEKQVAELTDQVQRLADFDGKVWEKQPICCASSATTAVGHPVVIALANLKGGVGKTTLTANLAAILAACGKRILLVDLDYQGSLTSLCLPGKAIAEIRRRGEFVDRLFCKMAIEPAQFKACCHVLPQLPDIRLLAADEPLADAENRLMAQWLLNPQDGDIRFLLQSYLREPTIYSDYDYVFIDCPPRLTTACINAMAAADFLLIPVILDQTSAEAAPRQIHTMENLKSAVGLRLRILGLVANRASAHAAHLIAREAAVWESLGQRCADTLGEDVYQFRSIIRQKGAFADAAARNDFAALRGDAQAMFRDLANELEARIAHYEHLRTAAVPPSSGPAA